MGCKLIFAGLVLASVVFTVLKLKASFDVPQVPHLEDTWWGPRDPSKEDTSIKPFKINVPDEVLKDLKHRLDIAKPFTPPLQNTVHEYGLNTNLLKTVVDFWKTKYDWREREKFLNQYPQFTVSVQGLRIHYLHIKPANTNGKKVLPLLLLHGWPGSVREFYEIIPLLTKPQKDYVIELIVPSLPGYGFSEAAVKPGLGSVQMAVVFKNFMKRLGHDRFYIQGGDWGGIIVQNIATLFPEHVIGVHSNMCSINSPWSNILTFLGSFYPPLVVDEKHQHKMYPYLDRLSYLMLESGYMHLQSTKPDTIGAALKDTPVGLAAYILEKFITWTNPAYKQRLDGALTEKFTLTNLLDNVMIYWVTDSITTSVRLYSETFNKEGTAMTVQRIPVKVPSACARFSHELVYQSDKILAEKFPNLIQSADYDDGGHFAAFEVPAVLAKDIHTFVQKTEALKITKKKQEL